MMKFIKNILGLKSKAEKELIAKEQARIILGLKNRVSSLTQPAVYLAKTDEKTNSKFGGKPVVDSQDFTWPTSNGKPLSFLAQIDLNEISRQYKYEWLNSTGSILFFYDIEEMPWGFDPKEKGKWKVIYQTSPCIEVDYPHDLRQNLILREMNIKAKRIDILPTFEDSSIKELNLSDEEADLFFEIGEHYEELDPIGNEPAHQVGGFPRPVQGDYMQFEAQQASSGVYMGDDKGYQNAVEKDFMLAKENWKLLFQFDSDDQLDIMWGDVGMLYFWVEKNKSIIDNFDDTWLIMQCC